MRIQPSLLLCTILAGEAAGGYKDGFVMRVNVPSEYVAPFKDGGQLLLRSKGLSGKAQLKLNLFKYIMHLPEDLLRKVLRHTIEVDTWEAYSKSIAQTVKSFRQIFNSYLWKVSRHLITRTVPGL
ncbi:hypothetical protein PInf_007478 [Phytophthora infestans]|nr:hypothetical protein PInf_007478 [Phytophthora infestans]